MSLLKKFFNYYEDDILFDALIYAINKISLEDHSNFKDILKYLEIESTAFHCELKLASENINIKELKTGRKPSNFQDKPFLWPYYAYYCYLLNTDKKPLTPSRDLLEIIFSFHLHYLRNKDLSKKENKEVIYSRLEKLANAVVRILDILFVLNCEDDDWVQDTYFKPCTSLILNFIDVIQNNQIEEKKYTIDDSKTKNYLKYKCETIELIINTSRVLKAPQEEPFFTYVKASQDDYKVFLKDEFSLTRKNRKSNYSRSKLIKKENLEEISKYLEVIEEKTSFEIHTYAEEVEQNSNTQYANRQISNENNVDVAHMFTRIVNASLYQGPTVVVNHNLVGKWPDRHNCYPLGYHAHHGSL